MGIKDIVNKLSSYNLFNYLFPGFLFFVLLKTSMGWIDTSGLSLIEQVVLIYFSGLVLSRIGSLVIEKVFLKYYKKDYEINTADYLNKSNNNLKLEIIFEAMNMYRTLSAMSLVLAIIFLVNSVIQILTNEMNALRDLVFTVFASGLFVLFVFAFCKQRGKVIECLNNPAGEKDDQKNMKKDALSEEIGGILKSLKNYLNK